MNKKTVKSLAEDIVRSIVEDGNINIRTDFAGVPKQYVFFTLYTDNILLSYIKYCDP